MSPVRRLARLGPEVMRKQFPIGVYVSPSAEGHAFLQHIKPWLRRGTVVKHGREGSVLYVRLDGESRAQPYGAFMWERLA